MLAGPAHADLRADVTCVAKTLLHVPVPRFLPSVRIVPKSELVRLGGVPYGWTKQEWAAHAGGLFYPTGHGRILLHKTSRALGHELAHFVLWANGLPWRHENFDANRRVMWADREFWIWCR